jgi:predicted PurR-regulated permease PerM
LKTARRPSPAGHAQMNISLGKDPSDPRPRRNNVDLQPPAQMPSSAYPPMIGFVAAVAALYFGRAILIPLSIAILLTFALAPEVSWLRKLRVPGPVGVVAVVLATLASIFLFGAIVATQLGSLVANLPLYQSNIEAKLQTIQSADIGEGIFDRASKLLERLGRQIEEDQPSAEAEHTPQQEDAVDPLPVKVIEPTPQPLEVLHTVIGPLVEPLAMGGIIIVVVIFMLLRREDLRNRVIRLAGIGDLHRTTAALQDAGRRVGQYLLMQLVVNVTYAIPIGIGLWVIGIPNALLWALLALVLRFVPYIGPVIAAIFPLALALAVDPGWTILVWTAALFIVLELLSNNVVEPWLYGSRTGLSPVAIIVAAIFWTWLWGPWGLLLSMPLTVCLVVLGRHVPQFEFLQVLFGNEPVLEPHAQLYQRLLAGDPDEATDRAERFLEENSLVSFYETVAIPALALGEVDRARGVMTDGRHRRVAESAIELVENLEDLVEDDAADDEEHKDKATEEIAAEGEAAQVELPDGTGKTVLCAGGRGDLDNAAALMLAQVMTAQGGAASMIEHHSMAPTQIRKLDLSGVHSVVIGFLNADSVTQARYMVRRLKRSRTSLRVGVVFWGSAQEAVADAKPKATINCDFVAHSVSEAVTAAFSDEAVVQPIAPRRKVGTKKPSRTDNKEYA